MTHNAEYVAPDFLPQTPDLICPDCGGPGVTWEDGFAMCDDCVRLMIARKALIDGPGGGE